MKGRRDLGHRLGWPIPFASRAAVIFALLSAVCWGFGLVAAKAALGRDVPPLTLAAVQLAASLAVLIPLATLVRDQPSWGDLARRASLSGVLEYSVTGSLFAVGVALTTAGNAALIGAAEPVMIALTAAFLLRERVGRRLLWLLAVVTAGLVLVVGPDLVSTGVPQPGDFFVLASTGTGALYAVLSRRLVADVAPLPLAIAQQAGGFLVLASVLFAGVALGWIDLQVGAMIAAPTALLLAVGSGLLQNAGAVWLHLHALRRMTAGAFALFFALIPIVALAGARVFLGESVTVAQLAGGALVITAALLAARRPKSSPLPVEPKEMSS